MSQITFPVGLGAPRSIWRTNLKRGWQRTSSSSGWSPLWLHPHWLKTGRRRTQRSWRHLSGTATCLKIKTRKNVRGGVPSEAGKDGDMRIHNRTPTPTPRRPGWWRRKSAMEYCQDPGGPCAIILTFSAVKIGKDGGSVGEKEKGEKRRERGRTEKREKGKEEEWLKGCFLYLR